MTNVSFNWSEGTIHNVNEAKFIQQNAYVYLIVQWRVQDLVLHKVVVPVSARRASMVVAHGVLAVSSRLEAVCRRLGVVRLEGFAFPTCLAQT